MGVTGWIPALARSGDYGIDDIKTFPIHSFHPEAADGPVIVLFMEQDASGFIWVGTDSGLYRFDGNRFIRFVHDPSDPHSIDDNFVSGLYSDTKGRLWIGTASGLQLFRPDTEDFERIEIFGDQVKAFRQFLVRRIVEDKSGRLYMASLGNGVRVLDENLNAFPLSELTSSSVEGMDGWRVNRVYFDKQGRLWISTIENGLFRYHPETGVLESANSFGSFDRFLAGHEVRALYDSGDGNFWFGTHGFGLVKWNEKEDTSIRYGPGEDSDRFLASESIRNILMDTHDNIWVGTQDVGLFIYNKEVDSFESVSNSGSGIIRMGEGAITSTLLDDRGDIWYSTLFSGKFAIFHINMHPAGFRYALIENEDGVNLAKKPTLFSFEDSKGNFWVGTDGEGLILKRHSDGSVTEYTHVPGDIDSLSNDKITSIVEGSDGNMWIGTRSGGLNKLSMDTGRFTRIPIGTKPDSIRGRAVWSLYVDGDLLWVGTEVGISLYDTKLEKALDPASKLGSEFTMPKRAVWSMDEDEKGNIWIASLSGLYVVERASAEEGSDSRFRRVTNYRSQSVHAGKDGRVFLATLENGLFEVTDGFAIKRPFPDGMNFESELLHSVDRDFNGDLWVTTKSGFVQINQSNGELNRFDSRWGFEAQYYWVHNALVSSEGRIYFPSRRGLLFFDPDELGFEIESLNSLVTSVEGMIPDSSVPGGYNRFIPERGSGENLVLKHSESVLTFHYSALFFPQPISVEYQTYLRGFDEAWSEPTSTSFISYPLLPPGDYEFQVRSRIVGQDWGSPSEAIAIQVLNPFYFRWWFIVGSSAAIVALLFTILQFRVRKMKTQRVNLEATVSQRTQQLSDRNEQILKQRDELEYHRNNLEELVKERTAELEAAKELAEESSRLKTAFLANMSHEIRTPLNSIVNFSQLLFDQNLDDSDKQKFKDIVENSSTALLRLIEDVLDIARLEAGELKIEMKPRDISSMINRLCETYQGKVKVHGMQLQVSKEIPENFEDEVVTDVIRLNQVLVNLLDNAVKFTEVGEVVFGFEVKENVIEFFVKDTGIGISASNIGKVFERFTKIEEDRRKIFPGAGLGLTISRRLVTLLGGDIRVESVEGEGTQFYFTIPYKVQPEKPKAQIVPPISKTFDWRDHTILVVEDEYSNVEVIKAFLTPTSAKVVYAEDGDQAVSHLKTDATIDLVLMDLKLPVMDGVTATQTIRTFNREVPIIAQTAFGVSHERMETLKCGFNDYVTKPLDRERLLTSIDHHLKQV